MSQYKHIDFFLALLGAESDWLEDMSKQIEQTGLSEKDFENACLKLKKDSENYKDDKNAE